MPSLTIRFRGICCHIDPEKGDTFKKRTILPQAVGHNPAHVPYVEFDIDAYDKASSDASWGDPIGPYLRDGIQVGRFELSSAATVRGELLEVENMTSSVLEQLATYDERIANLSEVEPRFTALENTLRQAPIDLAPNLVALVFDMPGGYLMGGTHEPVRTNFKFNPSYPGTWTIRRLASFFDLLLDISGTIPTLNFTSLGNTHTKRPLVFKAGADLITIGNQTKKSIIGAPESSVGHFDIYYGLSDTPIASPVAMPEPYSGYVVGCSNSNYP